jgi:hypothetical protein
VHDVRVIKRKMPQAAAIPPGHQARWREALLHEIASGRAVSSRGRRKMSNYNVRHLGAALHQLNGTKPVLNI